MGEVGVWFPLVQRACRERGKALPKVQVVGFGRQGCRAAQNLFLASQGQLPVWYLEASPTGAVIGCRESVFNFLEGEADGVQYGRMAPPVGWWDWIFSLRRQALQRFLSRFSTSVKTIWLVSFGDQAVSALLPEVLLLWRRRWPASPKMSLILAGMPEAWEAPWVQRRAYDGLVALTSKRLGGVLPLKGSRGGLAALEGLGVRPIWGQSVFETSFSYLWFGTGMGWFETFGPTELPPSRHWLSPLVRAPRSGSLSLEPLFNGQGLGDEWAKLEHYAGQAHLGWIGRADERSSKAPGDPGPVGMTLEGLRQIFLRQFPRISATLSEESGFSAGRPGNGSLWVYVPELPLQSLEGATLFARSGSVVGEPAVVGALPASENTDAHASGG